MPGQRFVRGGEGVRRLCVPLASLGMLASGDAGQERLDAAVTRSRSARVGPSDG